MTRVRQEWVDGRMRPVPDKTSCRGSILLNLCCAPWISGRSLPRSANWRRCYSRIWRGRRNWLALKIRSGPGCCSSFLRRDASEIEQADGTAEKFIGDAVMAAFGGPRHSRTTPSVHPRRIGYAASARRTVWRSACASDRSQHRRCRPWSPPGGQFVCDR